MELDKRIYIIGAGISGLITALVLEKKGYSPTIIEASKSVGGRVKTDVVNGYNLDHGFQVLLEAYPMANKYLDYSSLDLQKLIPGAVIFKKNSKMLIGDPLRDFSLFFPTLFAKVGSFKDKLAIFKLNLELKKKSIDAIFDSEQISTKDYLISKGFSDKIIQEFFKPFFTGIFLETELETSSVMFQFIYKMFGDGLAVIPKKGIQDIPNQLKAQLKNTIFRFDTKVKSVEENAINLEDNSVIKSDITVIATDASKLLPIDKAVNWKSCDNLYFEVEKNTLIKPIIGLIADNSALINNIYFIQSPKNTNVISVTIVKSHQLDLDALISKVEDELLQFCDIKITQFLKHYKINKALPRIKNVTNTIDVNQIKYSNTIYLAGDTVLNGSLNAAMSSGELVAELIDKDHN